MTFDQQLNLLTQNLLIIDKAKAKTTCEMKRNWKFDAIQRSVKIEKPLVRLKNVRKR
ncbi:unnamed protein product [Toxocara canis]|uniref:Transposase n=1 Tax=Toxocara canis TaxID=6265 RepID=A0A183U9T5_TOXCA|nr:unnamed protein product [Toxocara canis]